MNANDLFKRTAACQEWIFGKKQPHLSSNTLVRVLYGTKQYKLSVLQIKPNVCLFRGSNVPNNSVYKGRRLQGLYVSNRKSATHYARLSTRQAEWNSNVKNVKNFKNLQIPRPTRMYAFTFQTRRPIRLLYLNHANIRTIIRILKQMHSLHQLNVLDIIDMLRFAYGTNITKQKQYAYFKQLNKLNFFNVGETLFSNVGKTMKRYLLAKDARPGRISIGPVDLFLVNELTELMRALQVPIDGFVTDKVYSAMGGRGASTFYPEIYLLEGRNALQKVARRTIGENNRVVATHTF